MEKRHKFLKLKYYLIKYGMNHREMAELMGIDEIEFCYKIKGYAAISYSEMMLIYEVLNQKARVEGDGPISLNDIFLE